MKIIKKIQKVTKVIRLLKNWYTYYLDEYKLIKGKFVIYELKNKIKFKLRTSIPERKMLIDIWWDKCYNPEGFEFNPNSVVVDIGAHVGIFSVLASDSAPNTKVYAIEPSIENFQILKENIALNKKVNIIPVNIAIAGQSGMKSFFKTNDSCLHSFYKDRLSQNLDINEEGIKCLSLEDFINEYKIDKIDFLKLDCEGAEYDILLNASKSVLKKIDKISIEYHWMKQFNKNMLINYLKENNFIITDGKNDLGGGGSIFAQNLNFKK